MFIFGTAEKTIKTGKIDNINCPRCRSFCTFNYFIISIYTHITLIPLFPVAKRAKIECLNCKEFIDFNELSDKDLNKFGNENSNVKHPIWLYLGTLLFAMFLLYFAFNYFKKVDDTEIFIKNPTVNDVYFIKDNDGYYTALKIEKVTKDSILFLQNDYKATVSYEVEDLDVPENYSKNIIQYSKIEMQKLDEIISIKRNK